MSEERSSRPGVDGVKLLEEIQLLVDMVSERAGPWVEAVMAAGHQGIHRCAGTFAPGSPTSPESGESSPWCPLCTVVSVIRGDRPEFLVVLLEQAAQLIALLRAVLADRWNPEAGIHMPGFRPEGKSAPDSHSESGTGSGSGSGFGSGPGASRIHHIPVRRRAQW
jgi:hypothetical protein